MDPSRDGLTVRGQFDTRPIAVYFRGHYFGPRFGNVDDLAIFRYGSAGNNGNTITLFDLLAIDRDGLDMPCRDDE